MKTIEEKAKAYDETYKVAVELHNLCKEGTQTAFHRANLETMFPELAESEGEKVRKELIKHLKELSDWKEDEVIPVKNPSYYRQWASWLENIPYTIDHEKREGFHLGYKACLEKQGKQKFEMKTAEESLGIDSDTYNKIVDECIFGEQKPEENKGNIGGVSSNWSEEDKGIIEEVVSYLINYSNIVESKEDADRIEYLIDKIQDICPHQKQEWSEEDEQHIDSLLKRLDALCRNKFERTRFAISEDRDWLKSLRPQNRWKPSKEQMEALNWHIGNTSVGSWQYKATKELMADLKKLKGKV